MPDQVFARGGAPAKAVRSSDPSDPLNALLAEYSALRNEIEWLIKDANQYQTYALGLVAVLPPAFGLIVGTGQSWIVLPAMLVSSVVFCLLGFLYFRDHQEVYVVAAYLQRGLRPQVREILGSTTVLGWEEFKADAHLKLQRSSRLALLLASPRVILLLRLSIFLVPAVLGAAGAAVVVAHEGYQWWHTTYASWGVVALSVGFVLDIAVVVTLTTWFWVQGNFAKRTLWNASEEPTLP